MSSVLHRQLGLVPHRLPSGGCGRAPSGGGVSALPHVAMTAIVPYCRIEHNPARPKKRKTGRKVGHVEQQASGIPRPAD